MEQKESKEGSKEGNRKGKEEGNKGTQRGAKKRAQTEDGEPKTIPITPYRIVHNDGVGVEEVERLGWRGSENDEIPCGGGERQGITQSKLWGRGALQRK